MRNDPIDWDRISWPRLRSMRDYAYRHLAENPTLDDLAAAARLNPSYLCDRFKRLTGMTPMEWVRHLRVDHAKEFMCKRRRPTVLQAAAALSVDVRTLERNFRQVDNTTPGAYRRNAPPPRIRMSCNSVTRPKNCRAFQRTAAGTQRSAAAGHLATV